MQSYFLEDGDPAVQIWFVEAKAQADGLGEAGAEIVQGEQGGSRSYFWKGDGARIIVQSHCQMVAWHFYGELGFLSVMPGSKFPVMLLCQAPGYLSKITENQQTLTLDAYKQV